MPRLGAGSQPRQCLCKPRALPRWYRSRGDQAEEVGGERGSAFIFGTSSLKISPPSCLITLPFDLNESRWRPAPPSARCPLKEKGVGTGSCGWRDGGTRAAGAAGRGRSADIRAALALAAASSPARAAQREGGSCALRLAGPVRAPARIGWRGFRGSPTLQLKGPPRAAARRAPPGPANLAIQPAPSRLSALAPPPEKPGAASPAQRGWRRWPRTSTPESRR